MATIEPIMPSTTRAHKVSKSHFLKRSWEAGGAGGDGLAELSRPSDKLFKEVLDSLDKWKASFKGLQEKKVRRKVWLWSVSRVVKHERICHGQSETLTWIITQIPAQKAARGHAMKNNTAIQIIAKITFLAMMKVFSKCFRRRL
jgi:hypothetical protein